MKLHIAIDILYSLPVPWKVLVCNDESGVAPWIIEPSYGEELLKYGLVKKFDSMDSAYKRTDKGHELLKVYHEPVFNDFMELEEAMNVFDNLDEYMDEYLEKYNAEVAECN